jgi:hypothetical protein
MALQICRLERFWAEEKFKTGACTAIPRVPPFGQEDEWKPLKLGVKVANMPEWPQFNQECMWALWGTMTDGSGKQAMK